METIKEVLEWIEVIIDSIGVGILLFGFLKVLIKYLNKNLAAHPS